MKRWMAAVFAMVTVSTHAWAQNVPPEPQSGPAPVALTAQRLPAEPAEDAPPAPLQQRWYGWQTLLVDAASVLLVAAAPRDPAVGLVTFAAASPIVHAAHNNWGEAAGSLGLRLALPVVAAYAGNAAAACRSNSGESCGLSEAIIGGLLGALGASILDTALLAYDTVPVEPVQAATFKWTPTVIADQKRVGVGLQGTF